MLETETPPKGKEMAAELAIPTMGIRAKMAFFMLKTIAAVFLK